MIDDIQPPRRPKTKTTKKAAPHPEPKQEVELPELPEITSPLPEITIPIDEKGMSKLSKNPIKNLKNFHPKHWYSLNRKDKLIMLGGAFLILVAAWLAVYFLFIRSTPGPVTSKLAVHHAAPKITTVASPLTGVQVAPALAARPVTGIMIENSLDARPQSGLQNAGVVYEAIAEAGITRFLALFQDTSPQYIGPVRSLRPYYIDYAAPFQASIVHVGGSPDALSEAEDGNFRNLDQFYNGNYFTRISARDAPHNVYTSFAELDALNQSKGYSSSSFTSWGRKADKKLAVPTAKTIDFAISSPDYYAHYDYNAATNSYLRSEGGAPHMDLVSASDTKGVQLNPKVVIALIVPQSQGELDASGAYYTDYSDSGSGYAYIFQDGGVTQATWTKADTSSQLAFTDSGGQALKLDAGQTWITLLGSSSMVTYAP